MKTFSDKCVEVEQMIDSIRDDESAPISERLLVLENVAILADVARDLLEEKHLKGAS